ncbi:MAG: NADH:flavin oxidoreductase [Deltaproteobacteria bacterium]|nr:NADH:flavin oxidoreductase [Deltaproteobacteria bacterium]
MKLFEPYNIAGKLELPNRIVMPPLVTRLATNEGEVTEELVDRYVLYARGGVGLIVTEAVSVKKQKSGPLLRLSEDRFIPGLKGLVDQIHDASNSKVAPQLIHFLKISRSGYRQKVEDLTLEEIRAIPQLFAEAACRAREVGFDALELHFAHAYTMSSFLSRHNKRKDDYGGSLKNRLRLAQVVVERTRSAIGDNMVLGARMNGEEFTLDGNTLKQSRAIALRLAGLGLDYISISAGGKFEDAVAREGRALDPYTTGYSGHRAMPPAWMPEKVNAYLCADIKRTLDRQGHNPTMITAGRIPTASVAEEVLEAGDADLVAVARPILCDPFWPRKYHEGRDKDVQKCIYCNACRDMDAAHQKVVCVQWKRKNGSVAPPQS